MAKEGVCMSKGNMRGEGGNVWWGACMPKGGLCVAGGGHAWQERWPLQQMVCILLECVLVQ